MSWRSLIYFALAFCVSMANLVAGGGGPMGPIAYVDPDGECAYTSEAPLVDQAVPVSAAPAIVVAGLIVLAVATVNGRARLGRVTVRTLAVALLLTGGLGTATFLFSLFAYPDCFYGLGSDVSELIYYSAPAVPTAVTATAMFLAAARDDRG